MAEEDRSNERHEVMTYSKVINDAILSADLMSGIGQEGDRSRTSVMKLPGMGQSWLLFKNSAEESGENYSIILCLQSSVWV
jgi:hypothetical protein